MYPRKSRFAETWIRSDDLIFAAGAFLVSRGFSILAKVAQALTDRKLSPSEIEIFWYFVKEFINNLNKPETDQYAELSLAVRGLGLFATPCKVLLAEKELKELQGILVRKLSSLSSG